MKHPLRIERHTSNSFIPMRAAEAPCALNVCLLIIPDYARFAELPIIPETMHISRIPTGRSGLGPVTFLLTKHAYLHLELIIHIQV